MSKGIKPVYTQQQYEEYFKQIESEMKKEAVYRYLRTTPQQAQEFAQKEWKKRTAPIQSYPSHLPEQFKPIPHPALPPTLRSTIINMLLGQAAGDAVGLATEFLDKEMTMAFYKGEHIQYSRYLIDKHRSRWMNGDWRCADWTDDTDQAILIMDSISRFNGECNVNDYAQRLFYWLGFGFTEIGDVSPLGVGENVGKVTSTPGWVHNPIEVSKKVWISGGKKAASNGSVMRTSPAAIPYFWDEKKVVQNATQYGLVTHYDNRCQASVITVVLILAKLLQGRTDVIRIIEESVDVAIQCLDNVEQKEDYINYVYARKVEDFKLGESIGYTFKPMGCAIWCLQMAEKMLKEGKEKKVIFRDLVEKIVYEAGDADTNGCVVGAVLGAYLKDDCIPDDWLEFDNKNWFADRINNMLRLYELEPFHF